VFYEEISEFWQRQEVWNTDSNNHNFGTATENRTRLQNSMKKPVQELVILPANENYARIIMT
jgi:hypothetical protein